MFWFRRKQASTNDDSAVREQRADVDCRIVGCPFSVYDGSIIYLEISFSFSTSIVILPAASGSSFPESDERIF